MMTIPDNGYAKLIPELDRLARAAAAVILDVYAREDHGATRKADASPLTEADLASHRLLMRGLAAMHPSLPILSEENATQITTAERRNWQRYWLVDPLDGTKEFLKRNGEFTVNVALIEFGRPVLGIVHVPVSGVSYTGSTDGHAERRDGKGEPRVLHVAGPLGKRAVRIVGSRSHAGGELDGFAKALGKHKFLAVGSSLKFCLVAEGAADVYLRLKPTSEWDTAAGQAVLEAAGGAVTNLAGLPLRYNARDTLINPSFLASGDLSRDYLAAAAA
ncbi:MAG: 3'(2'),5'-bisphosphate nucleotidase CysQ [Gammaproteobacteria bacterium]